MPYLSYMVQKRVQRAPRRSATVRPTGRTIQPQTTRTSDPMMEVSRQPGREIGGFEGQRKSDDFLMRELDVEVPVSQVGKQSAPVTPEAQRKFQQVLQSRPSSSLPYEQRVEALSKWISDNRSMLSDPRFADQARRIIQNEERSLDRQNRQELDKALSSLDRIERPVQKEKPVEIMSSSLEPQTPQEWALTKGLDVKRINNVDIVTVGGRQIPLQEYYRAQTRPAQVTGSKVSYEDYEKKIQDWIENNQDVLSRGSSNYAKAQQTLGELQKDLEFINQKEFEKVISDFSGAGLGYEEKSTALNRFIEQNQNILGRGDNYDRSQEFLTEKQKKLEVLNKKEFQRVSSNLKLSGSYEQQVEQLNKWVRDNSTILGRGDNFELSQELLKKKEAILEAQNTKEYNEALKSLDKTGSYEDRVEKLNSWIENNADILGRGDNYERTKSLLEQKRDKLDQINEVEFQSALNKLSFDGSYNQRVEELNTWIEDNQDILGRGDNFEKTQALLEQKQSKLKDLDIREFESAKGELLNAWDGKDFQAKSDLLGGWIESNQDILGRGDNYEVSKELIELKQGKLRKEARSEYDSLLQGFQFTGGNYFEKVGSLNTFLESNASLLGFEDFYDETQGWLQTKQTKLDKIKEDRFKEAKSKMPSPTLGAGYENALDNWLQEYQVVGLPEYRENVTQRITKDASEANLRSAVTPGGYSLWQLKNNPEFVREYRTDTQGNRYLYSVELPEVTHYYRQNYDDRRGWRDDRSSREKYTPYRVVFNRDGAIDSEVKREIKLTYVDDSSGRATMRDYRAVAVVDIIFNRDGTVRRDRSENYQGAETSQQIDEYNKAFWASKGLRVDPDTGKTTRLGTVEERLSDALGTGKEIKAGDLFEIWSGEGTKEINLLDPGFKDLASGVVDYNELLRQEKEKLERARTVQKVIDDNLAKGKITTSGDILGSLMQGRDGVPMTELLEVRGIIDSSIGLNQEVKNVQELYSQKRAEVFGDMLTPRMKADMLEGDLKLSDTALRNIRSSETLTPAQVADIDKRFQLQQGQQKIETIDRDLGRLSDQAGLTAYEKAVENFNKNPSDANKKKLDQAERRVQQTSPELLSQIRQNVTLRNLFADDVTKTAEKFEGLQLERSDIVTRLEQSQKAADTLRKRIVDENLSSVDAAALQRQTEVDLAVNRQNFITNVDIYGETFDPKIRENKLVPQILTNLASPLLGTIGSSLGWFKKTDEEIEAERLKKIEKQSTDFLNLKDFDTSERAAFGLGKQGASGLTKVLWDDGQKGKAIVTAIPLAVLTGTTKAVQGTGHVLSAVFDTKRSSIRSAEDLSLSGLNILANKEFISFDTRDKLSSAVSRSAKAQDFAYSLGSSASDYLKHRPGSAAIDIGLGVGTGGIGTIARTGAKATLTTVAKAGKKATQLKRTQMLANLGTSIGKVGGVTLNIAGTGLYVGTTAFEVAMAEEGKKGEALGRGIAGLALFGVGSFAGARGVRSLGRVKIAGVKGFDADGIAKSNLLKAMPKSRSDAILRTAAPKKYFTDSRKTISKKEFDGLSELNQKKIIIKPDMSARGRVIAKQSLGFEDIQTFSKLPAKEIPFAMTGRTQFDFSVQRGSTLRTREVTGDFMGTLGDDLTGKAFRAIPTKKPVFIGGKSLKIDRGTIVDRPDSATRVSLDLADRSGRQYRLLQEGSSGILYKKGDLIDSSKLIVSKVRVPSGRKSYEVPADAPQVWKPVRTFDGLKGPGDLVVKGTSVKRTRLAGKGKSSIYEDIIVPGKVVKEQGPPLKGVIDSVENVKLENIAVIRTRGGKTIRVPEKDLPKKIQSLDLDPKRPPFIETTLTQRIKVITGDVTDTFKKGGTIQRSGLTAESNLLVQIKGKTSLPRYRDAQTRLITKDGKVTLPGSKKIKLNEDFYQNVLWSNKMGKDQRKVLSSDIILTVSPKDQIRSMKSQVRARDASPNPLSKSAAEPVLLGFPSDDLISLRKISGVAPKQRLDILTQKKDIINIRFDDGIVKDRFTRTLAQQRKVDSKALKIETKLSGKTVPSKEFGFSDYITMRIGKPAAKIGSKIIDSFPKIKGKKAQASSPEVRSGTGLVSVMKTPEVKIQPSIDQSFRQAPAIKGVSVSKDKLITQKSGISGDMFAGLASSMKKPKLNLPQKTGVSFPKGIFAAPKGTQASPSLGMDGVSMNIGDKIGLTTVSKQQDKSLFAAAQGKSAAVQDLSSMTGLKSSQVQRELPSLYSNMGKLYKSEMSSLYTQESNLGQVGRVDTFLKTAQRSKVAQAQASKTASNLAQVQRQKLAQKTRLQQKQVQRLAQVSKQLMSNQFITMPGFKPPKVPRITPKVKPPKIPKPPRLPFIKFESEEVEDKTKLKTKRGKRTFGVLDLVKLKKNTGEILTLM